MEKVIIINKRGSITDYTDEELEEEINTMIKAMSKQQYRFCNIVPDSNLLYLIFARPS